MGKGSRRLGQVKLMKTPSPTGYKYKYKATSKSSARPWIESETVFSLNKSLRWNLST